MDRQRLLRTPGLVMLLFLFAAAGAPGWGQAPNTQAAPPALLGETLLLPAHLPANAPASFSPRPAPYQPSCFPVAGTDFAWALLTPTVYQSIPFTATAWAGGPGWSSETVDPGGYYIAPSLALDSADHPHVSYQVAANQNLRYAYYDGSTWITTTVVTASADARSSLALDAADRPHISYYDANSSELRYAWFDGAAWHRERVDGAGHLFPSLALDASGRPHISYFDEPGHALHYAHFDGSAWVTTTVDISWGYSYSSLALDSLGQPHVGYQGNNQLRYAHFDGSAWITATVDDSSYDNGYDPSLALDAQDHPHIAHYDMHDNNPRYAWYDGTAWHLENIDDVRLGGSGTSLDLDTAGRPHVTYGEEEGWCLKHAWRDGAAWQVETVVCGAEAGGMALDDLDRPHIAHDRAGSLQHTFKERLDPTPPVTYTWNMGDGTLLSGPLVHHAYAQAGVYTVVLTTTNCTTATATAIHTVTIIPCAPVQEAEFFWQPQPAPAGRPVTFLGQADGSRPAAFSWNFGDGFTTTGQLVNHTYTTAGVYDVTMVARNCDAASVVVAHSVSVVTPTCQPLQGVDFGWSPPVPRIGQPVTFTSTVAAGGAGWLTVTVDPFPGTYKVYPSLALDGAGRPHVSYFGNGALRHAAWNGTSWLTTTVDAEAYPDWGGTTALDIDLMGRRHVAYNRCDGDCGGYGDLMYAYFDGASWVTETLASVEHGYWNALVADEWGRPHIAEQSYIGLQYTWNDGTDWQWDIVNDAYNTGWYNTLDLDAAGRPHIVDMLGGYGVDYLYYAWHNGAHWVGDYYYVGNYYLGYISMALDDAGRPHVSYWQYEPSGGSPAALVYGWFDGTDWITETVQDIPNIENAGEFTSLQFDSAGRPHIAYCLANQGSLGEVRYAYRDGSSWQIETVAPVGRYPTLALDAFDQPHLAYAAPNLGLQYAWKSSLATLPIAYSWDLGDGTTAGGPIAYNSYGRADTYTVVLTATNCQGAGSATASHLLTVAPFQGNLVYLPVVLK